MKKITMYTGPLCNYCEAAKRLLARNNAPYNEIDLSLIHISEPTRLGMISYAVFCLKKKLERKNLMLLKL